MAEEKTIIKTLRLRIIRPLLNEEGENKLLELKEKLGGHIPSNNPFWVDIKNQFQDIVTWNELGDLLRQIQKEICFIYNKAAAEVYVALSKKDFAVKSGGLNSILSKFGYPEAMKKLHDAYFALGIRQKLQSNFSGEKLRELRKAVISLPVARSDTFPIPITIQNGFKIDELKNSNKYGDYGDFVISIPFPIFENKKKIDKYKPWEKFDFKNMSKKKYISLLLSTRERKKIDKNTKIRIQKLKEILKISKSDEEKNKIIERIRDLQENLDFGTQAEIRRVVEGKYKITWVELNRGKRMGDKNKWYIHMTIKVPIREIKINKDIIGGIDIGCNSPVYCAVNNSFKRLNILGHDIIFFNNKALARRRILLKRNKYKRAGHGSKNKLEPITILTEKNELFRKKIMERWVKEVANFFIKNQAGIVQMENLDSMNNRADTFFNERLRTTWPYAKLQNMIKNKLGEYGIEIKDVKSKYTSQICSACGHWNNYFDFEYRKENNFPLFKCKNCHIELSSDYNAAKNIADPRIEQKIKKIEKLINKEDSKSNKKKIVKKK